MRTEEQYLRDELNYRISLVYSSFGTTMTLVLAIYATTISLSVTFIESSIFIACLPLFFYFTTVILKYSVLKYQENINQIVDISAYFICFFNSILNKDFNVDKYGSWEISSFYLSKQHKTFDKNGKNTLSDNDRTSYCHKYKTNKLLNSINKDYMFIVIINIILMAGATIIAVKRTLGNIQGGIFIVLIQLIIFVVSIYSSIEIIVKCNSKMGNQKNDCIKKWLSYALEREFYTKDDIKQRFGDILGEELITEIEHKN